MGFSEVSFSPESNSKKTGGSRTHHMVVCGCQFHGSPGKFHRGGRITTNLRECSSVHLYLSWDATKFAFINEIELNFSHRRCRVVIESRCIYKSLCVVESVLNSRELTHRQHRPGDGHAEHRPPSDEIVGKSFDPAEQ
jgi:hypothetical protein